MERVRKVGGGAPMCLSFDIDALDPDFAPGTGTVEPGGLSTWQAFGILRGRAWPNIVGGDLVKVSLPRNTFGNTAPIEANLLNEMLRALPGVARNKHDQPNMEIYQ